MATITDEHPYLTEEQMERLAYLIEELAEAQQAAAKILRHGYKSYDPTNPKVVIDRHGAHPNNKYDLETEVGHVLAGLHMLVNSGDVSNTAVLLAKKEKLLTVKRWLHHDQPSHIFNNAGGD